MAAILKFRIQLPAKTEDDSRMNEFSAPRSALIPKRSRESEPSPKMSTSNRLMKHMEGNGLTSPTKKEESEDSETTETQGRTIN